MTGEEILSDVYLRLSSRKLWLAVASIGFAYWSYSLGELSANQFQNAVMIAVGTFTAAEAAADTATAFASRKVTPDTTVRTTVNTGTDPAPEAATRAPVATLSPRRVRPSRAKPRTAVLTAPVASTPVRRPRSRPALEPDP